MEENIQGQNNLSMQPVASGNNGMWLKIVLLVLVEMILLAGVFYAGTKYNASKQQSIAPTQNQQKELTEQSKIIFPTSKLAYSSKGKAKIYNFRNNKEIDLGLGDVGIFLWSKNGKLAIVTQGESVGAEAGFNYLLYLADVTGGNPKLILPQVFGKVFWSDDSTGFYVSENYYKGKPLISGNQSGLRPDSLKTYFVSLDGTKKTVDKNTFNEVEAKSNERASLDNKYSLRQGDDFEKLIEIESGKEYPLKPGAYYTRTFNTKWSPNGDKIAFLYKVNDEATKNEILNITTLGEVLKQKFSDKLRGGLPSAESVDFDWIDNQSVVVSQLNYISQPGHYQGNIGIYDVGNDKFIVLIPSIAQQVPYSNTLLVSPDRKFFTYQISKNLGEEEIIIADLAGKEIKKLNGRDPSWELLK